MKKLFFILIAVLLLAFSQQACAQSEFPQEMWVQYVSSQGSEEFAECFFFSLPDDSTMAAIISPGGHMYYYRCVNREWKSEAQFSPVDGTWEIAFVRHDTTTPRSDGSFYPDELGFDLVNQKNGDYIAYHYNGEYMVECGWRKASEYQGQLCLKEEHQDALAYADQDMDGNGYRLNGTVWIAGVVDDELYVILTTRGETGYMLQEWFWEGNG